MKRSPEYIEASVLIATRNRPDALSRCLEALLDGEVLPSEVIIVNQGTTHPEVESRSVSILVIRDEGIGLSRARNLGLKAVTRPVVAVIDDDCVPTPSWLGAIARALSEVDAVTGRVLPLPADGAAVFAVSSRTAKKPRTYAHTTAPWRVGTGGNFGARTDLMRRLGGYDERLGAGTASAAGEDIDLIHRMLRSGATIRYVPEALVHHARVDAVRRQTTRATYGRGIGAFMRIRLGGGEIYALAVLGRWIIDRTGLMVRAVLRRDGQAIVEELSVLRGTLRGLAACPQYPDNDTTRRSTPVRHGGVHR